MTMTTEDLTRRIDRDVYERPLAAILKHLVEMIEGHTSRLDDLAVRDGGTRAMVNDLSARFDGTRDVVREYLRRLEALERRSGAIVKPVHASDCSLHNGPAYEPEACDCGAEPGMTPKRYGSERPAQPGQRNVRPERPITGTPSPDAVAAIIRKHVSGPMAFVGDGVGDAWRKDVLTAAREIVAAGLVGSAPSPVEAVVEAFRTLIKIAEREGIDGVGSGAWADARASLAAYDAARPLSRDRGPRTADVEAVRHAALEEAADLVEDYSRGEDDYGEAARRIRALRSRPAPEPVGEEDLALAIGTRIADATERGEVATDTDLAVAIVDRFAGRTIARKEG